MQSEELVEAAARRMAVVDGQNPDKLSHNSFEWWRHYVPMARAALEAALSAAEPVSRRNDEAGYVEFLNQDVPYIVRDIQGAVAILLDLDTRNVVGYRVYDPDSVFAPPAPSVAVKAEQPEGTAGDMTPDRAIYFLKRFKGDEKMLGPHEQWALDFSISALSAQVQDVAERKPLDLNVTKEWFEKRAALEGDHEIGAGSRKKTICIDPTSDELSELFRIAHRIPEGWQLVPVEPTAGMIEAAKSTTSAALTRSHATEIYRAILAAAPAKQEGDR